MKAQGNILQWMQQLLLRMVLLLCVLWVNVGMAQDNTAPLSPIIVSDTTAIVDSVYPIEQPLLLMMDSVAVSTLVADSTALSTDTIVIPGAVSAFNPDGMRAVWLSALCPGLGQIYNRRYWKLPIVVGGFVGLVYATSWNNRMLSDYQQAYLDIMDTDPSTNSYMDFFPPYYKEENLDKTWLTNLLKTRKDSYRHYRDYCIVGMVALYLVCILDAYVDAELYHFDMSTDLAVAVKPAIIPVTRTQYPALGLQCAITF